MGAREVRIEGGSGCPLAGTYVQVAAPVAAALLLPGTGRADRDSDTRLPLGRKLRVGLTRELAHSLAAARVSTLRYDKRGVGASGGDFWSAGLSERLADAGAALDWLAAHTPGLPLLVIGHSEGAFYAAELAAEERAAGVGLLSAAARRGDRLLAWQREHQRAPASSPLDRPASRLAHPAARLKRESLEKLLGCTEDTKWVQGRRLHARWLRDFVGYDPAPALARIDVPVLALTGGHDVEVPPEDVQTMSRLVRGPFEGHVLDGLNHLLRPDPRVRGIRRYLSSVREPVSPQVPALVSDWVGRHWGH